MSVRRPRSTTPMEDTIDEQARRQREKVEEEEQRHRDTEERRRLAEESARKRRDQERAEQLMEGEEKDAEAADSEDSEDSDLEVVEGDVTTMHNASRAASTRVLIPRKSSVIGNGTPIQRERPCWLCVISRKPCIDLPDSRSKQCERCLRQRKVCRPSPGKVQAKGKGSQVSPRAGDKRKRPKILPDDDDDEIQIISVTTAKARPSASTAPDGVAKVLDHRLGEITALLRDLVTKVDNLADPKGKGKGKLGDLDESADDGQNDTADGEDSPECPSFHAIYCPDAMAYLISHLCHIVHTPHQRSTTWDEQIVRSYTTGWEGAGTRADNSSMRLGGNVSALAGMTKWMSAASAGR
ncbi:hypothetical protein EDD15DRAFT_2203165 [Pisolithus albus]|nr:hypothetical protein EDD15DRAFT_2203165 [Pisolithus albus]